MDDVKKTIARLEADSELDAKERFMRKADLKYELAWLEKIMGHYDKQRVKLTNASGISERFRERTFKRFNAKGYEEQVRKAINYAQGFEETRGKGLLFLGSTGTGKTHLVAAIANYLMDEKSVPVIFTTSTGLFRALIEDKYWLHEIKKVPLLIIDDLGKEKVTEWNRDTLFEIINSRYEEYLPVVITSNDTPMELEQNVGTAVYSRLCEICDLIVMNGRDYRRS